MAVESLECAARVPKPLFSLQFRDQKEACHFVRCNELYVSHHLR